MSNLAPSPELVSLAGEQPTTDSRRVARHFGKRHDNVLRAIHQIRMALPPEVFQQHFAESSYVNMQGKPQPCVHMTKDGFSLLPIGPMCPKTMALKVAFFLDFEKMLERAQADAKLRKPEKYQYFARLLALGRQVQLALWPTTDAVPHEKQK